MPDCMQLKPPSKNRLIFRPLLTLLCLLTPWSVTAAPYVLTLSASIHLALTNSPDVNIAELQTQKAALELQKAKNGYLPIVSMTHTQTQWAETPKLDYGNYITMTLPLFDSGRTRYSILQSQAAANGMNAYLDYIKHQAVAAVIFDYFDALAAKERSSIISQNISRLNDHLTGIASHAASCDLQQTEALRTRLTQKYRLIQQEERQIHQRLRQLLRLPPTQELVVEELPEPQLLSLTSESAVSLALAHREDLAQLRQDQRAAQLKVKSTAKEAVPQVYLYSVVNNLGLPEQEWYSTLYITGNLFDGGQAKLKTKQSELDAAIAAKRLQSKIETITQETTEAFEIWQHAGETVVIAKQAVSRAEADYLTAIETYQNGQCGNEFFLEANLTLLTAKLEHSKARYYYHKCRIQLDQATGTLLAFDQPN